MLKKDITFENLDGEEVTQTFYFNMNKSEIAELEVRFGNHGLEQHFRTAVEKGDRAEILGLFKFIIMFTVGRRDGDLFIKDQASKDRFEYSGAYDAMFFEMMQNPASFLDFFRNIIPAKYQSKFDEGMTQVGGPVQIVTSPTGEHVATRVMDAQGNVVELPKIIQPDVEKAEGGIKGPADGERYTYDELLNMPQIDFDTLFGVDPKKWPHQVMQAAYTRRIASEKKPQ